MHPGTTQKSPPIERPQNAEKPIPCLRARFRQPHCRPCRSKRTLSAFPRAVGRTAANMVTFRDRNLAWRQWALFAGALANAGSSVELYRRCPTCTERDTFFYGSRPCASRLIGFELLGAEWPTQPHSRSLGNLLTNKEQPPEWRAVLHWVPTAAPWSDMPGPRFTTSGFLRMVRATDLGMYTYRAYVPPPPLHRLTLLSVGLSMPFK